MSKHEIKPGFGGVDPSKSKIFEEMPPIKHKKRKKTKEQDVSKKRR